MKIKNLESDRKQRIETLRETIRGCEREIRRLEENPDTCEEGIPGDPGSVLLEQGVYEHMMQRIEDTLNWCHIDHLLEKGDWNDQGCYIPNINDGGKMAQYDYHMLVRVRPSWEDILRNNRILNGSELPEEVIDILLNQSWEYCMPRYISRDELIYLIQNNFVIKAGSYFNKTKMDADNYYVKAYDMHELPEIINGLS